MHRTSVASWLLLVLAACGEAPSLPVAAAPAVDVAPAGPHRIVVLATMSLRPAFATLAARYEQDHPGAKVELHCDGGAALLAAMSEGRPADVVAIGDSSLMSRFAAGAHLTSGSPRELGRNRLAIAVARGNPKAIAALRDLTQPGLRVALGKRSASVGRYARWALSHQGLEVTPAVEADHADGVLAAVAGGTADAGIVYVTTARGADGVDTVAIPEAENQPVLYSISTARGAAEPQGARAFVAFAVGEIGQGILRAQGLLPIGSK